MASRTSACRLKALLVDTALRRGRRHSVRDSFLLGTFHGVSAKYLQEYLNEFCYRFNRRLWEGQLPTRLLNLCLEHTAIKLG